MRKGDDGEEKSGEKMGGKKKIMMKIVATDVVASQPPERRPTATPTARAKRTEGRENAKWGGRRNTVFLGHLETRTEVHIELVLT